MSSITSRPESGSWINPFREGSKRRDIAALVRQGKSVPEIQRLLEMKNPTEIYKVRSELKNRATMAQPPPAGATEGNGGRTIPPATTGNGGAAPPGSGLGADALPLRPTEQLGGDGGKTMPLGLPLRPGEAVIAVSGIAPGRTIQINPKILTMHQWLCASTDYNGDIGDFLNDTAEYFFRVNNYVMKIVKEEIIE